MFLFLHKKQFLMHRYLLYQRLQKFMCRSEVDLLQELDLPFSEVTTLKNLVSSHMAPSGQTVRNQILFNSTLSTGLY
jgi:hypothetical protein